MTIYSLLTAAVYHHRQNHGENPSVLFVSEDVVRGLISEMVNDWVWKPCDSIPKTGKFCGVDMIEKSSLSGITVITIQK